MGDSRHMEHRPVQNSEVFLLGTPHINSVPPPSPPSPPVSTPGRELCEPLEELSLETVEEHPEEQLSQADERLRSAVHVLNTEAVALRCLTSLYDTDPVARDGFHRTVEAIIRHRHDGGKLVISGVGKSGLIAKKLVATFKSLGIQTDFLHPTEAFHGDLGGLGETDTVMIISFSGKTTELLTLIPHLRTSQTLIILTSHTRPETCEFIRLRPDTILLPAPIHQSETSSFGVSAPTTSTTMALAVGDAVAITAANELHVSVSQVFARNHPGGAIGASLRKPQTIRDLAVSWADILHSDLCPDSCGADLLRAGFESTTNWVRMHEQVVSPSRIRKLNGPDYIRCLKEIPSLLVSRDQMISISGDMRIRKAVELIRNMQVAADEEEDVCNSDSIIAVVDKGDIIGVLEVGHLLDWRES